MAFRIILLFFSIICFSKTSSKEIEIYAQEVSLNLALNKINISNNVKIHINDFIITSNNADFYFDKTNKVVAINLEKDVSFSVEKGSIILYAQEVNYDLLTKKVIFKGKAYIHDKENNYIIRAKKLIYDIENQKIEFFQIKSSYNK